MLASTYINQSAPNLVKIYMTLRSWMRMIMGLIEHKQCELFALQLELVYLTWFTPSIYDANLKIFMFEPVRFRALKLCMNHHFVNVYKFCILPLVIITGPVQ